MQDNSQIAIFGAILKKGSGVIICGLLATKNANTVQRHIILHRRVTPCVAQSGRVRQRHIILHRRVTPCVAQSGRVRQSQTKSRASTGSCTELRQLHGVKLG